MAVPRVLLVHGAATTPAVWDRLLPLVEDLDVSAPRRRSDGDLGSEVRALTDAARGSVVVGVSGGATLGLALAAAGVPLTGAVLHEPAVGSLVPGLLDHVAAAYAADGVPGFGRALYGSGWTPAMAPQDPEAVARDLAMFRSFEPAPLPRTAGEVLVTVGADSPPMRHAAAAALRERIGVRVVLLPGCGHFVQHDRPDSLVDVLRSLLARVTRPLDPAGPLRRG
jgi:pimeloyl-ACP methyl ester carboxylesterase